jgi:hypothetical protein
MIAEVAAKKEECLISADSLRQEIVSEVDALRVALAAAAQDRVDVSAAKLADFVLEALASLTATLEEVKVAITDEKKATLQRIIEAREKTMWAIK